MLIKLRLRQKTGFLIKESVCSYQDFNIFMHDHTLHRRRKHFYRCCLKAFSTEEISKCHIKDCFKINGKQRIKMSKKGKHVR